MQICKHLFSRADRRAAGFSLVEVLVGLFLLSIGLLALAPMFVQAARSNAVGADMGWVGAAATERMERLREIDYEDLTAGGSLTSNAGGFFDASAPNLLIRWEVVDNTVPANTKTVNLVAEIQAVTGPRRRVSLTTLRAR